MRAVRTWAAVWAVSWVFYAGPGYLMTLGMWACLEWMPDVVRGWLGTPRIPVPLVWVTATTAWFPATLLTAWLFIVDMRQRAKDRLAQADLEEVFE